MDLTLKITERCNFNCLYCHQKKSDASMSFELIKKAVDMGVKDCQSTAISFYGGEPLTEIGLIYDTLLYCHDIKEKTGHKFNFQMTTNGSLLTEDFIKMAKQHNLLIALSYDGLSQGDTRKSDGRIEEIIPVLLSIMPYAPVIMTVHPNEAGKYCDNIIKLKALGFKNIFTSPAYGKKAPWDDESLGILEREYKKAADIYAQWTHDKEIFTWEPFDSKLRSHIFGGCGEQCQLGKKHVFIDVDGNIYPCNQFGGLKDYHLGHVDNGIDKEKALMVSLGQHEFKDCTDCAIKDRCRHNCGCLNRLETGDANEPSSFLCSYERMLIPIADSLGERLYKGKETAFLNKQYDPMYGARIYAESLMTP